VGGVTLIEMAETGMPYDAGRICDLVGAKFERGLSAGCGRRIDGNPS